MYLLATDLRKHAAVDL